MMTILKLQNSNQDVKTFEKDCVNKIFKVKRREGKYSVTIINSELSDFILELFGESY